MRASFVVAVLCGVVAVVPMQARAEPVELPPRPLLDEPAPFQADSDARVRQFLGALGGGLVGLGAGLALNALPDASCFAPGCFTGLNAVSLFLSMSLGTVGAWAGHRLFGGHAGWATTWLGLLPGMVFGMTAMGIAGSVDARSLPTLLPAMVASGVVTAAGMALALTLRDSQLSELGAAEPWGSARAGRYAAVTLVNLLTTGATAFGVALMTSLSYFLGTVIPVVATFAAIGLGFAGAFTNFAVHRAMKGQATVGATLLGTFLPLVVGGGALLGYLLTGAPSGTGTIAGGTQLFMLVMMGSASMVFVPGLVLEASHTAQTVKKLPQLSFSAAPLQNGAMVGAGFRF